MNFWATIEHSLNYKYQGEFPDEISERLRRSAEAAYQLDEEMSNIREEIQEAQRLFSHGKGNHKEQRQGMKYDRDQSSNYQQSRRKVDACHKAINRIVGPV